MDKSYKKPLLLITFGVVLFTALSNLGSVVQGLETCLNLLTPVLAGLLTAFVLSVPMRGLARHIISAGTERILLSSWSLCRLRDIRQRHFRQF